jgi:F-type H+-transporting ATPase subunit gamma
MMTQTATVTPILPLTLETTEEQKQAVNRDLILYEPNSEEVFNSIIPEYIAGIVYGALCESVASELAARRTAMDAATKNATEMIDHLNLYYNRARQAAITQEITEIVAGAEN